MTRFVALAVLAWIGAAGFALSASRPDPVATMAKVARDLDLQTQMPKDEPLPKETPWSDVHWHIPAIIAQSVMWGAVVIGLGFVAYALRDTVPQLSRRSHAKPDAAVVLPIVEALERMHEAAEDADALARRGLFAEAMHMLLLRSLVELRERLDVSLADSLTSREILRRLTLPALGRQALADVIQRVEFVHFGRRAASPEDYGACRASYEQLIGAMSAPPAVAA